MFASGKQSVDSTRWNVMYPAPDAQLVVVAGTLEASTCPDWSTRAQNATYPAIDRPSNVAGVTDPFPSFLPVTAPFRSCLVPTLFRGMLMAA
jgi:hypothetical protein